MRKRKMSRLLILVLCAAQLFCYVSLANAESSQSNGAATTARLDFRITIPTVLHLQVGTVGATRDLVTFAVTDLPGTGAVAGVSSGANPVPVRVAALIGPAATVTLRADSSTPLTNGSTTIPFSEISWTAGGSGGFTSGAFSGGANQQLDQFTGPGSRTGTYSFSYANTTYYPATVAPYNGTVTYTLTSP